ncbi:MAG TPA: gluconate 2-dehydrogenase subunit 3 family protein [Candidatus Methylomirabilis sp.]|nr:gluconate 2-dehydrogenase subunit 3 family protein [Candidatus Methylomirabilis sp.]
MAFNHPIDLKQDRRQWLKTSATMLGAAAVPLSGLTADAGPAQKRAGQPAAQAAETNDTEARTMGRFFTPAQHALIEELSETILPADSHSGGAKAAKVADFIEQQVRESTDEKQKALWREGLRLIELMSEHYTGKPFVNASQEERITVLQVLSDNDHITDIPEVQFFLELKRLTVRGYYTSKIGIHDELEYKGNRILMEFVGCDDPTPSSS